MKKIVLALMVISLLLGGCRRKQDTDMSEYYNEFTKAQKIAVVSADSSSIVQTLTDKKDIEDFVLALNMDRWELGKLPEGAEEIGSFALSQEETMKFGQTETDRELYDVCRISVYDARYISFEAAGLSMVFKIGEDTADYLEGFFEQC